MKIGVVAPLGAPFATQELLVGLATELELRGFESLWLGEHVVTCRQDASRYPYSDSGKRTTLPGYGLVDPLTTLALVAGVTTELRLATGILVLAQRNPVITAFQAATVHWLSGGRLELGIGLNWNKEEYQALQVPWERRGVRTDEYITILRELWLHDPAQFHGEFYSLPLCTLTPRLDSPPRIHVSGNSDAALRRVASLGDGWYGLSLSPAALADRLEVLDRHLAEQGRKRAQIQIGLLASRPGEPERTRADVEQYVEVGVDRLVLPLSASELGEVRHQLDNAREMCAP